MCAFVYSAVHAKEFWDTSTYVPALYAEVLYIQTYLKLDKAELLIFLSQLWNVPHHLIRNSHLRENREKNPSLVQCQQEMLDI